jgi:hypothetical protein
MNYIGKEKRESILLRITIKIIHRVNKFPSFKTTQHYLKVKFAEVNLVPECVMV